jgi:uncharacterized membrane protein
MEMESKDNNELLDLPATTERLQYLARPLSLDESAYQQALKESGLLPDSRRWLSLMSRFLLVYASLLILSGIAAFFAFNWADLPALAKFGLIEAAIVISALLAWYRGLDTLQGQSALFASAFLVGVLLAVYGQVYQTGADPYGLFLGWSALILGWAIIGRQAGLWMLMVVLINLSLILYWVQVLYPPVGMGDDLARILGPMFWLTQTLSDFRLAQLVFVLNTAILLIWEFLAARGIPWMQGRWLPRVVASIALFAIVVATLMLIFASFIEAADRLQYVAPVGFVLFTALCLWYYQKRCHDLYILTVCLVGIIVVITSWIAHASHAGFDIALFLALLVIGQTAGAAVWLRKVAQDWRSEL